MPISYLLRRLVTSLIVVAGVVTLTFFVSRILPSDPARLYVGVRAGSDQVAAARTRLGLDKPVSEQFVQYIGGLLRGDFGDSFRTKRRVRDDLSIFLPATLELVLTGFLIAVLIGIPAGVLASAWQGRFYDGTASLLAIVGASAPVFALALLGQQIFFNQLHWLPLNGRLSTDVSMAHPIAALTGFYLIDALATGNWDAWRDAVAHLVLPALVVAAYPLCVVLRMTRNTMVDVLHQPHIVAARAKGLCEQTILLRHALPYAILPVLTIAGLTFAYAITGSVLVELLFRWPGIGKYLTDAILAKDFPVIVAVTLVSTLIFVAVAFLLDVLRAVLDPRVKVE